MVAIAPLDASPHVRRATSLLPETLPVAGALADLLPHGGLARGSVVQADAPSLLLALVADAVAGGSWLALTGLPELGVVALAEAGLAPERVAVIPDLDALRWPKVVAVLADAVDLIATRPPARLSPADARRIEARVRDRGAVLFVVGDWPGRLDLTLRVASARWEGLGCGHGMLRARYAELEVTGRGAAARTLRRHVWLPAPDGTLVRTVDAPAVTDPAAGPTRSRSRLRPVVVPASSAALSDVPAGGATGKDAS